MENNFKVGDIVARNSYEQDTMFKITDIEDGVAELKGVFFRVTADATLCDLVPVKNCELREAHEDDAKLYDVIKPSDRISGMRHMGKEGDFFISGRILHVDGDEDYLERSSKLYEHANVHATTIFIKEKLMAEKVPELVKQLRPNIVVITGHDAIQNKKMIESLDSYRSSKYFVNTVNELRKLESSLDYLIIVAGACQSHFEALIGSGANFASSPKRINIHALDPAIVAASIALTHYEDEVDIRETLEKTVTKIAGIGGMQTRGTLRFGLKE